MTEDLIEQYKCEIQEIKLKHRKLRMRFANQLQQLTEEHKKLHSVFSLEGLPDQLKSSEETINQLLSVEQRKLAQWQELSEEVEKLKKQAQLETVAPQPQDE
ncbi:uncharacterized protein si:ch211-199g17.9 [Cololabis saira]|uniref:uncharacterized protein si:ch211-199g17.9 n=1 Tax=Cololabis saira TaxID=129043 RepID=UPI002AD59F71|nr:uncharacterized protein si:ch211-199g17.9 [Cololabis saira]